jgi:2-oxoisovalerate dehydrogenase E1 component
MILRVPIGAYGSGGPYHSSSVESVVANIKGIKIAYPSNGADLKGLLKAAYKDPNPVVIFEHKGLYWSKVPGTHRARNIMPDKAYTLPFGKANVCQSIAQNEEVSMLSIISYGMGVHWAMNAAEKFPGRVEVIDLRTIYPLDMETVIASVKKTHRCLVVTEETIENSFAQTVGYRVQDQCFEFLDAPVRVIGSENLPAIPLNSTLEQTMIPSAEKVAVAIDSLLKY